MSVISLKTKKKYGTALGENEFFDKGAYYQIGVYNPSGTTSVTFSSIPQTYTHLQLRIVGGKSSPTDWLGYRFNGDTGTNYSSLFLSGQDSTASASQYPTMSSIYGCILPSDANMFGAEICDILDYTSSSKYKSTRAISGYDNNSAGGSRLLSGLWQNQAAITSITISTATNYTAGTSIALYGIKG